MGCPATGRADRERGSNRRRGSESRAPQAVLRAMAIRLRLPRRRSRARLPDPEPRRGRRTSPRNQRGRSLPALWCTALTPAPHETCGRDRLRGRDRRQDESPRCAPPRVVGVRQGVGRFHRRHQAHLPRTTRIGAARQRPSASEIEHTVLVGAERRPGDEHGALRVGRAQLEPDALQPLEPFEPNAHRLVLDRHRRRHLESQYGVRGATAARRHNGEQKAGEQSRARPAILARRRAPIRTGYCRL